MKNNLFTAFLRIATMAFFGIMISCAPEETYHKAIIETTNASLITDTTATTGGYISSDEDSPVLARGVCWSTNPNPTINDNKTSDAAGTGTFISKITGLSPLTTYYLRAYATNKAGTAYGIQIEFTTTLSTYLKAIIETTNASLITDTTVRSGGYISSDEGYPVLARGVCWSTNPNPTINDNKTTNAAGTGYFTSDISGLSPLTTYFLRAYATNKGGTSYGLQIEFTTMLSKVYDVDGNEYATVKIGNQLWLASNLKTTKYRNGDPIVNQTNFTIWTTLTTGAYIDYDNDPSNGVIYGHLYNWYAVNDSRKLAPEGWHVATDAEWEALVIFLGGPDVAGGKLKETGDHHWLYPNYGATNESGFKALPGGVSNTRGWNINVYGYWWSSTEYNDTQAWYRYMHYNESYVGRTVNNTKNMGLSVRCVKD